MGQTPNSPALFTDRLPLTEAHSRLTELTELTLYRVARVPYISDLTDLSKVWVSITYFLQCKVTALKI